MLKLIFPIKPIAKERPRFSRHGGAYTPSRTRLFEAAVSLMARQQLMGLSPLESNLELLIMFYMKRSRTSKLTYPHQDLDNLIKSVCDGMNGVVYLDDKQIVSVIAHKRFDDLQDYIVVEIKEI